MCIKLIITSINQKIPKSGCQEMELKHNHNLMKYMTDIIYIILTVAICCFRNIRKLKI